jgi:hypothetical protein
MPTLWPLDQPCCIMGRRYVGHGPARPSGSCSLTSACTNAERGGCAAHDNFSIHDSAGVAPRICPSAPSVHRDKEGYGMRRSLRAALPQIPPPRLMGRGPAQASPGLKQNSAAEIQAYFAGLYQLSRPFCSFSPATSGVSVPLMTLADSPGLVFEVRRATRQDLVGRADRRLALFAPGDEFLGQRIGHLHRRRIQAEEARQRVGVDVGELGRSDPGQEASWLLPALACSWR